jgi:hypothetical protein
MQTQTVYLANYGKAGSHGAKLHMAPGDQTIPPVQFSAAGQDPAAHEDYERTRKASGSCCTCSKELLAAVAYTLPETPLSKLDIQMIMWQAARSLAAEWQVTPLKKGQSADVEPKKAFRGLTTSAHVSGPPAAALHNCTWDWRAPLDMNPVVSEASSFLAAKYGVDYDKVFSHISRLLAAAEAATMPHASQMLGLRQVESLLSLPAITLDKRLMCGLLTSSHFR